MTDIDLKNIRKLDPTAILVFLALMQHRKTTAVAAEMGLTQPAVSNALRRLREAYGDDLFLRKPHGLEPTGFAELLEPQLLQAAQVLHGSLDSSAPFDPKTARVNLRIAAYDYELATILPQLISELQRIGSNITVAPLPVASDEALDGLAKGTIDMAVGFLETLDERRGDPFLADHLYDESYAVVAHRDHPLLARKISSEDYAAANHLLIAARRDVTGIVDHALGQDGLRRNVVATIPSFFPALELLSRSTMIATMPTRILTQFAKRFDLDYRPLPFSLPAMPIRAARHVRNRNSAVHDWMVDLLRA